MSYSFVWLYLLKCVFTCSIFVDSNTKRFLIVLGVFGKYFVFTKTEKFLKQCCPNLATQSWVIQVAFYSRKLVCWFWRLVHEWKVQSRGVHRDFWGSARDSLASRPSSREKHLEIFFHNFVFECFGGLPWRLVSVAKSTCFAFQRQFFFFKKPFSVFPQSFVTIHCLLCLKLLKRHSVHTQTLLILSLSSPIFKKRYGFCFLLNVFLISCPMSLGLCCFFVILFYTWYLNIGICSLLIIMCIFVDSVVFHPT